MLNQPMIFVFLHLFCCYVASDWKYDDDWSNKHKRCSGDRQSPIVINKKDLVYTDMPSLKVINYDVEVPGMRIQNNGHTIEIDLPSSNNLSIAQKIQGGSLSTMYALKQLHFHWGQDDTVGSEHEIFKKSFPLEMHLVHTRMGMSLKDAADNNEEQTISVLVVLFEVSDNSNAAIQDIIEYFTDVKYKGTNKQLKEPLKFSNLLPSDTSAFYAYNGSLTTPPCSQNVSWLVLHAISYISDKQLTAFRSILGSEQGQTEEYLNHDRAYRSLRGRKIWANINAGSNNLIANPVSIAAAFLSLLKVFVIVG